MAEIITLGSLYFDGVPQAICDTYNGGEISFGPAVPDMEIEWVKLKNGFLISNATLCTYISWMELHSQGFVFGTPVQIDGTTYLCRCLKVGAEDGAPNEWDAALDEAGESNDLWNWAGTDFWGQETTSEGARAARACYGSRKWNEYPADSLYGGLGFRPLLEPLRGIYTTDGLIGKNVRIFDLDSNSIAGRLLDVDDYDLIVVPSTPPLDSCSWAQQNGEKTIVNRSKILWIQEDVPQS